MLRELAPVRQAFGDKIHSALVAPLESYANDAGKVSVEQKKYEALRDKLDDTRNAYLKEKEVNGKTAKSLDEAVALMAKAAEIFVQNLAVATHAVASTRTLRADHVAQAVRDRPDFAFLRVEFPKVDYKPKEAGPKKGPAAPANQPSIASFFKKPKPEAEA